MKNIISIAFSYDDEKLNVDEHKVITELEDTFKEHLFKRNDINMIFNRAVFLRDIVEMYGEVWGMTNEAVIEEIKMELEL